MSGRKTRSAVKKGRGETRKRLTREDWLKRALEAIGREGRGWIGIHELVELIGVTKGSFYWHFTDREDFVEALLSFWAEESTLTVARKIDELDGSPDERLLVLAQRITEARLTRNDLAMRAWALSEPAAAQVVKKVERFRRDYVRSLFQELGFRGDDLEMRADTYLVFYSCERSMYTLPGKAERLRRLELRHRMLVRK